MPRGQIHINLPPEHPIMSFETIEIKMAAVSAKRSIGYNIELANLVYCLCSHKTWLKNRHFSDADGNMPDTRFLLFGNGLTVSAKIKY